MAAAADAAAQVADEQERPVVAVGVLYFARVAGIDDQGVVEHRPLAVWLPCRGQRLDDPLQHLQAVVTDFHPARACTAARLTPVTDVVRRLYSTIFFRPVDPEGVQRHAVGAAEPGVDRQYVRHPSLQGGHADVDTGLPPLAAVLRVVEGFG